jgi:hypothetical protein
MEGLAMVIRKRAAGRPSEILLTVIAVLLAGAVQVAAQVSPVGPDFQVNTYTPWNQVGAVGAPLSDGSFVAVWQSDGSDSGDTYGQSVQARLFDRRGLPLGDQFQVNVDTAFDQAYPSIASQGEGGFVVVWENGGWSSPWGWNIRARRFDSAGTPLGGEFQVNTETTGWHRYPSVASDAAGEFVVVWEDYDVSVERPTIRGRTFSADGEPSSGDLDVSAHLAAGLGAFPQVAVDSAGGFVAAWIGEDPEDTDPDMSVQARRFDASGTPLGDEFQVNTYTTGIQQLASIAADPTGGFLVAWTSEGSNGADSSYWSVLAQRFDAAGEPSGAEFEINSYTTGFQWGPVAAFSERGDFVVTWTSSASAGSDDNHASVQAQRFRADGTRLGEQFQANTYTPGTQNAEEVVVDALGNFALLWDSDGSSGSDDQHYSVQARLFDDILRDGFETGDTSRWSSAVP